VIDIYNNLAAAGFRTASWWRRGTAAAHHNSAVFSFCMQATINRRDNQQVSVQRESGGNGHRSAVQWQRGG